MKFKHFTMEELNKMTRDQQRGYVLSELLIGFGHLMVKGVEDEDIKETMTKQLGRIGYIKSACEQLIELLNAAMTEDTEKFEKTLQHAVLAPNALNYK